MPRRAIYISVLACLCLAPDAALAAGPLTTRDATPGAGGSQVDPSVAVAPSGQRLLAATDASGSTIRVWKPTVNGSDVTWSDQTAGVGVHPSIAWDGGATAYLTTETSPGCGAPSPVTLYPYTVGTESVGSATSLSTFVVGASQTWPRTVLRAAADFNGGEPITVADEEDCGTGEHRMVVAWGGLTRPVPEGANIPTGARYADVASLGLDGANGTRIMIAYLGQLAGGDQDVAVRQCIVREITLDCTSTPAPQVVESITPPGTITIGSDAVHPTAAPSIACDAGTCHVVWTESASGGSRTRVFYSRATSADNYTSWTAPVQVSSSATSSQFLPSVSARGGRADIVYLDTRLGAGKVDAIQTSLSGMVRGRDVSLTVGQGYNPSSAAALGDRTDAGQYAKAGTTGVVFGYFPDDRGNGPGSSEGELSHGTTMPKLPAVMPVGTVIPLGKNTSIDGTAWLNFSDDDGDPVTVTVDDPAHGSFANGTYAPDTSYAGDDTIVVRATDGVSSVNVPHPVTIENAEPVFDAPAPAIVDEGGVVVNVPLHATDPDVNDAIVYSLFGSPPMALAGPGRLVITGSTLRITIPSGVRASSALMLHLKATDTTTGEAPKASYQDLSVTIRPNLRTPTTQVVQTGINVTGHRARVTAGVIWDDIDKACLANGSCHVRRVWNFGDGTAQVTTTDADTADHEYTASGNYTGQVTSTILLGTSQVSSPPESFPVRVSEDGRVLVSLTTKVATKGFRRTITVTLRAKRTGTVRVSLKVAGYRGTIKPITRAIAPGAPQKIVFTVNTRLTKSRRATIKVTPVGMLSGNVAPSDVLRSIRF